MTATPRIGNRGGHLRMTVSEVLALLDAERDERGMSNWEKLGSSTAGMRSYGIGLTRLRKLAKRIGRNRELAHASGRSYWPEITLCA